MELDRAHAHFPLWIELSGLPGQLHELAKGPAAWMLLRKLIELDIATNRLRPGLIDVAPVELANRTGIPVEKIEKAVAALRKAATIRAFYPENPDENGLFQILTPLPTPRTADEVRAAHGDLFLESPWPPRYAVAAPEEGTEEAQSGTAKPKIKRVVELYFNVFSMKMNSIILDQLQLISDRYELPLIERVFATAQREGAGSLSWILSEIRREAKAAEKAKRLREETRSATEGVEFNW